MNNIAAILLFLIIPSSCLASESVSVGFLFGNLELDKVVSHYITESHIEEYMRAKKLPSDKFTKEDHRDEVLNSYYASFFVPVLEETIESILGVTYIAEGSSFADVAVAVFSASVLDRYKDKNGFVICLAGNATRRHIDFFIGWNEANLDTLPEFIGKKISEVLKYADKLMNVEADELINFEFSQVLYKLPSKSGEDVLVEISYSEVRPNPPIENTDISLEKPEEKNNHYICVLQTEQNCDLRISFDYKHGRLESCHFDTDFRPPLNANDVEKAFIVKSKKGYEISFTFYWKGGVLVDGALIQPRVNPFCEINIETSDNKIDK